MEVHFQSVVEPETQFHFNIAYIQHQFLTVMGKGRTIAHEERATFDAMQEQ